MFGIFKFKSSKHTKSSEKTHWVQQGDYTFNKGKPESDLEDTFNKVTHGRVAEMLDEDDMAWTIPKRAKTSKGCVSMRCFDA